MQRRLRLEGTSFREQKHRAVMERAMELLAGSDARVSEIARAVGCATARRFTDRFRAAAGVPPTVWRTRTRANR